MESAGRDWLPITGVQLALDRSLGLHREVGATVEHPQQAPRAVGDSMVPSQTGGQRRLVKRSRGSNDHEADRKFRPVTEWAVKIRADMGGASCRTFHPRPRHQRGTMSHVLTMVASKLRNPIADVVSPEPDDRALHAHSQPDRVARRRAAARLLADARAQHDEIRQDTDRAAQNDRQVTRIHDDDDVPIS